MYNLIQTMGSIVGSLVQDGCPTNVVCRDVIDTDPRFLDAADGNLRLRADSPAVDLGLSETNVTDVCDLDGDGDTGEPVPVDLVRNPRAVDADGDGVAQIDLGAYEVQLTQLTIDKQGQGRITSTPTVIDCGDTCSAQLACGSLITLTATTDSDWHFAGWHGDVTSTQNPLALTMDGDKTVMAKFEVDERLVYLPLVVRNP